jgi:hypothetical protein
MGGQPWPELELHGQPWGSSPERKGKGEGEEGEGGGAGGAPWGLGLAAPLSVEGAPAFCKCCSHLLYVRRRREGGKREEKENKKRKNVEKYPNLKIFGEKNKR